MSKLLFWPTKYYFYPIGNTSAISLIGDLPLEEPAKLLLLGCGDPRNVLYTIFTEPSHPARVLDFTCVDFDPAVIARNILLFTMIVDDQPFDTIWNSFFHFRLDKSSRSALLAQCNKLLDLSDSLPSWSASVYAPYIRLCTAYTLSEVRRHWKLYIDMPELPESRLKAINATFTATANDNKGHSSVAVRSVGPALVEAASILDQGFQNYWKTGTTFSDHKSISGATEINPTFVYSLGGEGGSFHYGSDPVTPFHLAPVFGNTTKREGVSMSEVVKAAKDQFSGWCSSYRASTLSSNPPIIRLFVGDANAVCHALRSFHTTGTLTLGLPVAQWKTHLIQLDPAQYRAPSSLTGAPSLFNVIHTSNLEDHIGLLNVIISTTPLLSPAPSSALYSESLLCLERDATKEFKEHLKADITAIGLLIGLVPCDYLCGFSSLSNTHEVLRYRSAEKRAKGSATQFHQVTAWKWTVSGDVNTAQFPGSVLKPTFDPGQLGTLLYDIYDKIFGQETSDNFWEANKKNIDTAFLASNLAHYNRESFILFLKLVRNQLDPSQEVWNMVMDRFSSLQLAAWDIMSMDTLHYQDVCGQLFRHGVYKMPFFAIRTSRTGPFASWDTIPELVRIVLVIPRHELSVLQSCKPEDIGTPPLQCDIFGERCHNCFTAVHVAFGRAVATGPKGREQVVFEEDIAGWKGTSSLVASFVAPSWLLVHKEPYQNISIGFGVRNTPAACVRLIPKLGLTLRIFKNHVYVLPEYPLPSRYSGTSPQSTTTFSRSPKMLSQLGTVDGTAVSLDEQCELVESLTGHISLTDEASIRLFSSKGSKLTPQIKQLSPCVIRVGLGDKAQDLAYPFPVQVTNHRLRLARKSRYIEVIVLPSRSFLPDGLKLNPYPVVESNGAITPWSIHRVNLSILPSLDPKSRTISKWVNAHISSMLSDRERANLKKNKYDALMFVKDTIHAVMTQAAGVDRDPTPKRLFCLRDKESNNSDTVFFIDQIRFDLASHTLVADGFVLPLSVPLLQRLSKPFGKLVHEGQMLHIPVFEGEMQSWKQLLPVLVERCRTSWAHGPNCEYKSAGIIPLTEMMEADPLCSCGRGKDNEAMHKVVLWKPFAPYVTRFALSPLFAVSYLENVGRSPQARKCSACRKKGKPSLKECGGCKNIRYCSPECQKKDWKAHKPKCKS
ncbi:hypothetical protein FA15DRAFT_683641 [Coprinopsis marcescibilis]|uniref:MYND-type domain-containing protein n=1 Tax=Coprinopsis marcescibilis TaxID=230819 RepID=A0A5C3KA61_COPMA|nr:hypothetical protein FA15DRAFT_683641 [Coprinopsis marcescibilis]